MAPRRAVRWTAADLVRLRDAEASFSEELDPLAERLRQPDKIADALYPLVLICRAHKLPEPVPEFEFAIEVGRKFRFDYAWPIHRVAVEIDGGIWKKGGGAHSHPANIERDIEKGNLAVILGWRVLRYAPEDLSAAIPDLRGLLK